jgi:hypothetical protein
VRIVPLLALALDAFEANPSRPFDKAQDQDDDRAGPSRDG